eukprot:CAMPEP_0113305996 /NCGR_PEP_ID=MMETSP0010_2-20120614/5422_1 /TAXON_ID=216773 ORGANISM="Corethron hystrix, Strain 308" /NCGR_SAMPLE_ID=MMETSP0010_2 /ASSEMBLY_ACC=CAM_ASM_000155 /LENGTH=53 /DNA_ID=CAMNT_0000160571 /DNA_START=1104 /DNA_END=1265 /DNA_ORIENTATION=- /assembly_acc=CAM_ASM_000155
MTKLPIKPYCPSDDPSTVTPRFTKISQKKLWRNVQEIEMSTNEMPTALLNGLV